MTSIPGVNTNLLQSTIPSSIQGLLGINAGQGSTSNTGAFNVRLVSVLQMLNALPSNITQVVFDVTPTIAETQSVEYSTVQPIHMPGGIQIYKFTNPRQFALTAHFISRTSADALKNIQNVQLLRSWTRPFFGASSTNYTPLPSTSPVPSTTDPVAASIAQINGSSTSDGVNLLGAPPEVLYFYGYSTVQNNLRKNVKGINLNRIPVVMTSIDINFPEDVDYIPISTSPNAATDDLPTEGS